MNSDMRRSPKCTRAQNECNSQADHARFYLLRIMSLDGSTNFSHAHKNQYTSKNVLHKDSEYVRHVHMTDDTNNNQM